MFCPVMKVMEARQMYSVVIVHCGVIKISEIRIFCIDYSQRIDFLFSLLFM